jgi:hypothetical protein
MLPDRFGVAVLTGRELFPMVKDAGSSQVDKALRHSVPMFSSVFRVKDPDFEVVGRRCIHLRLVIIPLLLKIRTERSSHAENSHHPNDTRVRD